MKMFSIFIIAYLLLLAFGNAARYEFIFDNEEIFESCPGIPGNNGVHDLFDLSDMIFELSEGRLEVSGNSTSVWEGVEPTDRIQVSKVTKFYFYAIMFCKNRDAETFISFNVEHGR